MARYLLKRMVSLVFVIFSMTIIIFGVIYLLPADPARAVLGPSATNEQVEQKQKELGLDKPPLVQYGKYIQNLAKFDMGTSIQSNRPVSEEIGTRFAATMELTLVSFIIYILLSVFLGSIAALRRGSVLDGSIRMFSILGISIPGYWLALVLQFLLFFKLGLLPSGMRLPAGVAPPESITGLYVLDSILTGNWETLRLSLIHLAMPVICLVIGCTGITARMMRGQLLQELRQEYIRTARSKGIHEAGIVMKHAMRNAVSPVMTIVGMQAGGMIGGTVLIEKIFNWPGLGNYALMSIRAFDLYVVAGIALIMSIVFVGISLVVDILYVMIDPRVRLT